jgi:hypothetical protein
MSEHVQIRSSVRQSRQYDAARDLLKKLQQANPEADRLSLIRLYVAKVRPIIDNGDDPDAVEALIMAPLREWVGANIREPRQPPQQRAERAAAKAAYIAEISARDNKRVEEIVTRRLLEYEMMDGRVIGDLTGAECRKLSERCGVFFHVISDQIPARAKVRNHYTELELQALARHHSLIV